MTLRTSTPFLASLCGGYLHEDFTPEYGSAVAAVQTWLADASADDAVALSAEWRSFLNVTYGMSAAERAQALRTMVGGAWAPANSEEFDAVSALLIAAGRV